MMAAPPRPLSFLVLERYALGELTGAEMQRVQAQLAHDPTSAERLTEITRARALAPLEPGQAPPPAAVWRLRRYLPALAAAAVLLLAVAVRETVPGPEADAAIPPAGRLVKGGEVSLVAVGERHGEGTTRFDPGERLKLRITCPPGLSAQLRARVFQAGARDAPLAAFEGERCGNHVVWPGAFSLDVAEPAVVCVGWGADGDPRTPFAAGDEMVCVRLRPAGP